MRSSLSVAHATDYNMFGSLEFYFSEYFGPKTFSLISIQRRGFSNTDPTVFIKFQNLTRKYTIQFIFHLDSTYITGFRTDIIVISYLIFGPRALG